MPKNSALRGSCWQNKVSFEIYYGLIDLRKQIRKFYKLLSGKINKQVILKDNFSGTEVKSSQCLIPIFNKYDVDA